MYRLDPITLGCDTEHMTTTQRVPLTNKSSINKRIARERIGAIKVARGCENPECPIPSDILGYPEDFDFDHIDQATKSDSVSRMAGIGRAWSVIEAEIAKCRVLCVVCHRRHTVKQANANLVRAWLEAGRE